MTLNEGHVIQTVQQDSIADELNIESGDILLTINDEAIEDVFDYRYLIQEEFIEVLIRKQNGEEWLLEIEKEEEEDLGLEFDNGLMSGYRSCRNHCIFCFIDQMPPGMRETLYFKDDDSRLSFLQGNYITLTNMERRDIERIIRLHLAPINLSIQTMNQKLRCKMLNNRFAGEKLKYLDDLYDGEIEMNGQIVLCKHVNDGAELQRTIQALSHYLPYMRSVSVVPVGMTKYRQDLYPLETFTKQDALAVIAMIESRQQEFYEAYGLHFIHASDEWYILAEKDFPHEESYDGYIQLENGVGMMRMFINEFDAAFEKEKLAYQKRAAAQKQVHRVISIATAKLSYPTIKAFAYRIMAEFTHIRIYVYCIENDFFGQAITVTGLITGQDLVRQLAIKKQSGGQLGEYLLISANMLKAGEQIFLDDYTCPEVEAALKVKVVAVKSDGRDFLAAVLNVSDNAIH